MENLQSKIEISIAPGAWSQVAESWLALALQMATLDDLKAQYDAGASLFYVTAGGVSCGAFLLRVDQAASGPQGVIVAAAGRLRGVDLLATLLLEIENLFIGCDTFRLHSARPGMAAKVAALGYVPGEIVYWKTKKCTQNASYTH